MSNYFLTRCPKSANLSLWAAKLWGAFPFLAPFFVVSSLLIFFLGYDFSFLLPLVPFIYYFLTSDSASSTCCDLADVFYFLDYVTSSLDYFLFFLPFSCGFGSFSFFFDSSCIAFCFFIRSSRSSSRSRASASLFRFAFNFLSFLTDFSLAYSLRYSCSASSLPAVAYFFGFCPFLSSLAAAATSRLDSASSSGAPRSSLEALLLSSTSGFPSLSVCFRRSAFAS